MTKNMSVMGIYSDRETVLDAISVLQRGGYRTTDVSILSAENQGTKDFAIQQRTKPLEGAATGTLAGAALGCAIGWLVAAQTIVIPQTAPLVLAGPVFAMLAGAGALGTLGWFVGALAGLSSTEYVARRFAGRIRHGGILLSVHCDNADWCDRARQVLRNTGARCISSEREARADFGATDKPSERAPSMPEPVLDSSELRGTTRDRS